MSERPPQRAYDRLVGWLVSLPGRLRRAWRYGSAYYHGGTTQRIITYAIFLSLLVIFLVFFAGSVLGWMWQLFEPLLTSPAPAPTPAHPTPTPTPAPTPIPAPRMLPLFNEPARKFFETDVLRHFVAVGMAIWVSVRVAAIYFGDLHRIGRFRVASRLFRHMLLALPYGQLNLAQGALQTRQPGGQHLIRLLRVGVPVRVRIAADTCAVVEGIFAEPYVVGPTGSSNGNLLRGFSRLRRVVDLREHTVSLDVDGRTRDGLALTGRGLGLSFSVYRAGRPATDESVYPYDNQAILNLVYRTWLEGDYRPAMIAMIESELRQFISNRPLAYFVHFSSRAAPAVISPHQRSNPLQEFVVQFNQQAQQIGIELRWNGRGEWQVPEQVDFDKQLDAWQQNVENLLRSGGRLPAQQAGLVTRLERLIREVPLRAAHDAQDLTAYRKMRALVRAYRDKLQEAAQVYRARGQDVPTDLVEVIDYLTQLINR